MVMLFPRRWWVGLLVKELKGVVGQHEITMQVEWAEHSIAVAMIAYLLLLRLRVRAIPVDRPWNAFRLQPVFAWEVLQAQCERSARQNVQSGSRWKNQHNDIQLPVIFDLSA